jgi:hypothetical protein
VSNVATYVFQGLTAFLAEGAVQLLTITQRSKLLSVSQHPYIPRAAKSSLKFQCSLAVLASASWVGPFLFVHHWATQAFMQLFTFLHIP